MLSGAEVLLALRGDDGGKGGAQAYVVDADTGNVQGALKKEPLPASERVSDDHYRAGLQCLQGGAKSGLAKRTKGALSRCDRRHL